MQCFLMYQTLCVLYVDVLFILLVFLICLYWCVSVLYCWCVFVYTNSNQWHGNKSLYLESSDVSISLTDSGSLHLMEAQVSLINTSVCNSSSAYNGRISQDMLCARETGANTCHVRLSDDTLQFKTSTLFNW